MAREFKAACALEGVSAQKVLMEAVLEFMETHKKNPE
jgi:hypothetical protein